MYLEASIMEWNKGQMSQRNVERFLGKVHLDDGKFVLVRSRGDVLGSPLGLHVMAESLQES